MLINMKYNRIKSFVVNEGKSLKENPSLLTSFLIRFEYKQGNKGIYYILLYKAIACRKSSFARHSLYKNFIVE
jgi:hypothetical protein